jgi:phage tail-like protein
MSYEIKTIREGGNNGRQIRLAGPVSLGQLTLKRGMTESFDMWTWFTEIQKNPSLRADAVVVMFASDQEAPPAGGSTPPSKERPEQARFVLSRCIPMKIKAPGLNAKDGLIAVEELQLAYESLEIRKPKTGK